MKHDTEKLQDLYEATYLRPVSQQTVIKESFDKKDEDGDEDGPKKGRFVPKAKKKSKSSKSDAGALYNDSTDFNGHFDRLLREFDETAGGNEFDSIGDTGGSEYDFDEENSDEQISVSKSVLKSILDQLKELIGETDDMNDTFDGDDDGSDLVDDEVPLESYAFSGSGREHGAKGNYDGRAKIQGKSRHVKDNGDANFNDQDTGYDPEDTEGSEGAHKGDQGNYDGKAKPQPKSNLVGDGGNANFGKAKTGYGKPNGKNYF